MQQSGFAQFLTVFHMRIVVEVMFLYTVILITLKRALFVPKIKLVGNEMVTQRAL